MKKTTRRAEVHPDDEWFSRPVKVTEMGYIEQRKLRNSADPGEDRAHCGYFGPMKRLGRGLPPGSDSILALYARDKGYKICSKESTFLYFLLNKVL